ncbi:hypothetical protein OL229_02550 [Neisseriaceae bacterium JH1-16]|nr:hypothetical protein [Neisseriaceae bacterium JH1-16]
MSCRLADPPSVLEKPGKTPMIGTRHYGEFPLGGPAQPAAVPVPPGCGQARQPMPARRKIMAKGQLRGNREPKKPKKQKQVVVLPPGQQTISQIKPADAPKSKH